MNVVWKDEDIQKCFKDIGEMISLLQKSIQLTDKRLKLLEASQFRQPLVLTKEMEVKNQANAELKLQAIMGQILYHTALLAPSLQGADPWFIVPRQLRADASQENNGPGISGPWQGRTDPALRRRVSSAIALELVRRKLQAASRKRQALTGARLYDIGL